MALFSSEKVCSYELVHQGEDTILRVNCEECSRIPSVEDNGLCMAKTIEKLSEAGNVTKLVFAQKRDYEYDYAQTQMLLEVARLYTKLVRQRIVSYDALSQKLPRTGTDDKYAEIQNIVYHLLKSDPLGAYVELKRILRREKIELESLADPNMVNSQQKYISVISYLINVLDKTRLVTVAKPYLAGYQVGDRDIYRRLFSPTIKPDFMYTKLMANYPVDGEEMDSYDVNGAEITIFGLPDTTQVLYHVLPPEFKLSEDKYDLLDIARKILSEHKPNKSEFVDPERMRHVFSSVGSDLLEELSANRGMRLRDSELQELTEILVRYTVGFGLIEVLLNDEKVQDITINSPMGQIPMFLVHSDYDDCKTNIIPTMTEAESWASKMRMISGRPLDEANPILDTELVLPGANARVCIVSPPLNPSGLAYAFRRHRDKPWTLPLFINNRMMNPLAAGVLSFVIDGSRTILVAGTRSAGKSSLLGSMLVEIMRKYRIITIEDTLELPCDQLRKLGYNIQSLKVASALSKGGAEVPADVGIRTTLRMGDSCLIVGEVRSTEARSLYEAMRVGALANVVAGTIHGDSPYGVFDRVVNDLNVPKTSFKATDIIVVANPVRSADGLHRWRRITQITEVRKHWQDDPMAENGFVDLFKYDARTDQLEPSKDLMNGESEILKSIAGNVKEWAGNWDAVWENIMLRTQIKQAIVDSANTLRMPDLLEAKFVIQCNDQFHRITEQVKEEFGTVDAKRVLFNWTSWLNRTVKKINLS
ncbi:MAG: type II/IV secretion system ATPase subunit [Candidatus Woesearchaeota archaeon]